MRLKDTASRPACRSCRLSGLLSITSSLARGSFIGESRGAGLDPSSVLGLNLELLSFRFKRLL